MVRCLAVVLACSSLHSFTHAENLAVSDENALLQKRDMEKHKVTSDSDVDEDCAKGKKKCVKGEKPPPKKSTTKPYEPPYNPPSGQGGYTTPKPTTTTTTTEEPTTTTPTTTTTTTTIQPENCPIPENPKVCHAWGEPHFTHLFYKNDLENHLNTGKIRGQISRYPTILEFMEAGVFTLAKQGDNEVQAFFAKGPGLRKHNVQYPHTTTIVGLAVKTGGHVFQVTRDPSTAGHFTGPHGHRGFYAFGDRNFDPSNVNDLVNLYVDGKERKWEDIGPDGHRGTNPYRAVGGQIPMNARGETLGSGAFVSQLIPTGGNTAKIYESNAPVCVGNEDFLVEWVVPYGSNYRVFEAAVTIFASNPEPVGVCGDQAMADELNTGAKGYLGSGQGGTDDQYQVTADKLLFTTQQMKILCESSGMLMAEGKCGLNSLDVSGKADVNREDFCIHSTGKRSSGYTLEQAEEACKDMPESWKPACELEMCASDGNGLEMIKLEEHLEEFLADHYGN